VSTLDKPEEKTETRSGGESTIELFVNRHIGNGIHLFLSGLALLILIAAAIAAVEIVAHEFPRLWQQSNEYEALHQIIQDILLVAIAAELALLLVFHRTSAAIEVVIFVIARKMVTPGISALDLFLGAAALGGLIVIRFYFLPVRRKGGG
jgi:hypothetical protein